MKFSAAHPVIVKQVPRTCGPKQNRAFLEALHTAIAKTIRPSVVLDCAEMQHVDAAGVDLLLCCLEETMKRNGDVRLAAISPEARPLLERAGVRHLFRIFDTCADAVRSFQRPNFDQKYQAYTPAPANSAADAA
jgi:anti-anti-sigma factor